MNCATFMAGWVEIATGVDHLAAYRGRVIDQRTAAYAELTTQDGDLVQALTKRFGEPVHPSRAQRGDLAFMEALGAGGIYFTSGARSRAFFLTEGGFSKAELTEVDLCFRVVDRCEGWPRKLNEYMLEAQREYRTTGFSWTI